MNILSTQQLSNLFIFQAGLWGHFHVYSKMSAVHYSKFDLSVCPIKWSSKPNLAHVNISVCQILFLSNFKSTQCLFFFFLQQLLTSERLDEKFGCQIPLRYSISKMSSNLLQITFFMVPSLNICNDCCEIFAQILFKIYFFGSGPSTHWIFFHTLTYVVIFEHEYLKIYWRLNPGKFSAFFIAILTYAQTLAY